MYPPIIQSFDMFAENGPIVNKLTILLKNNKKEKTSIFFFLLPSHHHSPPTQHHPYPVLYLSHHQPTVFPPPSPPSPFPFHLKTSPILESALIYVDDWGKLLVVGFDEAETRERV